RYRESKVSLVLEPIDGVVRIAAERAPRLVAWPLAFWALGACLGLATWTLLFLCGGWLAVDVARIARPGSDDGTHFTAAAFGAATPWRREALRTLVDRLPLDGPEALDRAEEIFELLGDCRGLVSLDVRRGRNENALRRADACGFLAPADLLFDAGRLRDASVSYRHEPLPPQEPAQRALRRAEAHLAAHDWVRSADAVLDYTIASGDKDSDRQEAL